MEWQRRHRGVTAALRKFGAEISSNLLNKDKNKPRETLALNRKRKFGELNEEHKQEEYGQALKRTRYNLRSRKVEVVEQVVSECTESTASVSVEELGRANVAKFDTKKTRSGNTEMEGEASDEDIDLIVSRKKQQDAFSAARADIVSRVSRVAVADPNKIIIPLRRSQRLRNKRARLTQQGEECGGDTKLIAAPIKVDKTSAEPQYILEPALLQCDEDHIKDELWVAEYASEIAEWYCECEDEQQRMPLVRSNYISSSFQRDLNSSMRLILLDWLLNVHRRFKLSNATFFLAVYILDAYLSVTYIKRNALQMVGCCSMWIASKYHEIYAPESNDFVYIADRSFDIQGLFDTEIDVLTKLEFRFANIITPLHFIERYLQIVTFPLSKKYQSRNTAKARRDGEKYIFLVRDISLYFAELSLFDCKLVSNEKPSKIAAAAICFTILSISLYPKWPDFMLIATKYEYQDLLPVMLHLNEIRALTQKNPKLMAVQKKHVAHQEWIDKLNISLALSHGSK